MPEQQIFHDHTTDLNQRAKWFAGRFAIYAILIFWTLVCLFPIYWTFTTSFKLAPNVMPYDDRLDGPNSPVRGTRSDFPQRAARHFVKILASMDGNSASHHVDAVTAELEHMRPPAKHNRRRLSDEEIRATIQSHWDVVDGQSSTMLRHLRDKLGVACEQSRFAELFRQIKDERRGQLI